LHKRIGKSWNSMSGKLFSPIKLGDVSLKHRVVLAPLTRLRGDEHAIPTEQMVEYYSQRATDGGLLISEGVLISPEGIANNNVTGIWSQQQTQAWKQVVDAVHAKGGKISCQLWHTGRIAHDSFRGHAAMLPGRLPAVSASDVTYEVKTRSTLSGEKLPMSQPRALLTAEISRVIEDYALAARNAKLAGFDMIELHAAHGYLGKLLAVVNFLHD